MSIFDQQFDENKRANKTSVSRWHKPDENREFEQPNWHPIKRQSKTNPVTKNSDTLVEPDPLPVIDHPVPPASGEVTFDDQDLALIAAKIAHHARLEGEEIGRQSALAVQNQLLQAIEREVGTFARSVELPIGAIREELIQLLDALLANLSQPEDHEQRRAILIAGIEECLGYLSSPAPLTLHLNEQDAELVDVLLTKLVDSAGEHEIQIKRSLQQPAGRIRLDWPGGGLERVVMGRHAALHSILKGLAGGQQTLEAETLVQGDDG